MRSPRRGMCAAILSLEAIAFGLVTPGLVSLTDLPLAVALGIGLGLALACLLLAGMLRGEWAYLVGWALQVAAIAVGFLEPLMFVVGGVFALLWGTADFLGRKIESERAAAYAEHEARQAREAG